MIYNCNIIIRVFAKNVKGLIDNVNKHVKISTYLIKQYITIIITTSIYVSKYIYICIYERT